MNESCAEYHAWTMQFAVRDIFLLPLDVTLHKGKQPTYIVYAPLANAAFQASLEIVKELVHYFSQPSQHQQQTSIARLAHLLDPDPDLLKSALTYPAADELTELDVLLNQMCNFSCSYCYSAKGRSSQQLDWERLEGVLRYFFDPQRTTEKKFRLVFSGGGEPLLSWDILHRACVLAKMLVAGQGRDLEIALVTNATLLTQNILQELQDLGVELVISFDILRDVHEQQRGHYDSVCVALDKAVYAGFFPGIRATITPLGVHRLEEMMEHLADRFPNIRSCACEIVLDQRSFANIHELQEFLATFLKNFYAAQKIAQRHGIHLANTLHGAFDTCKVHKCGGLYSLSPYGTLGACSRVASPSELQYDFFRYGDVEATGRVRLDKGRYAELMNRNVFSQTQCASCFAKWHCAGGCLLQHLTYPEAYQEVFCNFTREFFKKELLQRVLGDMQEG